MIIRLRKVNKNLTLKVILLITFVLISTIPVFSQVDSLIHQDSNKPIPTVRILQEESNSFFNYDFLKILCSVLVGSGLTLLGVHIQNKHQSKMMLKQIDNEKRIAQSQITVSHREKWIDSIIEIEKNISKNLFYIFHIASNIKSPLLRKANLENKIKEKKEEYNANQRAWIVEEIRKLLRDIEKYNDEVWICAKDYHYWIGSLFLFFYQSHKDYDELRNLSNKLSTSFDNYVKAIDNRQILTDADDKLLGDAIEHNSRLFLDKLELIVYETREFIESIVDSKK